VKAIPSKAQMRRELLRRAEAGYAKAVAASKARPLDPDALAAAQNANKKLVAAHKALKSAGERRHNWKNHVLPGDSR
jgi:hypothetical protein